MKKMRFAVLAVLAAALLFSLGSCDDGGGGGGLSAPKTLVITSQCVTRGP
jgi:hypothetical protein